MEDYLDKHNVYAIFQHLLTELAVNQPEEPLDFMVNLLEKPTRVPKVIVQGPPGSGTADVTHAVAGKLGAVLVDVQSMLSSTEVTACEGDEEKESVAIAKLFRTRIVQEDCKARGWVVRDFPQSRSQARAMQQAGLISLPR